MKKMSVKIPRNEGGDFDFPQSDNQQMWILGHFLSSDVGCYWPSFKKFALENLFNECSGNCTNLEKKEDYILISDQFSEQPDGGPFLKVPKQEFIRLLDEWEKICKQKPQEILITFDGERFTIETKKTL